METIINIGAIVLIIGGLCVCCLTIMKLSVIPDSKPLISKKKHGQAEELPGVIHLTEEREVEKGDEI